jgi:hypothetical protein
METPRGPRDVINGRLVRAGWNRDQNPPGEVVNHLERLDVLTDWLYNGIPNYTSKEKVLQEARERTERLVVLMQGEYTYDEVKWQLVHRYNLKNGGLPE